MSDMANPIAEAQGFIAEYLFNDDDLPLSQPAGELDRAARIMQALLDNNNDLNHYALHLQDELRKAHRLGLDLEVPDIVGAWCFGCNWNYERKPDAWWDPGEPHQCGGGKTFADEPGCVDCCGMVEYFDSEALARAAFAAHVADLLRWPR